MVRYEKDLVPLAHGAQQGGAGGLPGWQGRNFRPVLARRNETELRLQAVQLAMDTARLWAQLNFLVPADPREARR
jgi:hypothetical protein